jgi:hypothetical protein
MGTAQSGLGFTPRQIEAVGYTPAQQAVAGQQTGFAYQPSQAAAQQLATTDISQYQSPYQQEVIDMTMRDIASAQEKALNLQGAQAQRAGAFGGSRQGVAEAETRAAYGQQAADAAARLRQQGFQQAMGAAQFDIGQRAATEAANVAARQAAERFGVGSLQQAQAANIARGQQVQASNVAAQNAAAQYAAQQAASAQSQNLAAQQAAMGTRLGAAGQLAGLGQQAFGTGQAIQQQQMQQGLMQQGLQQGAYRRGAWPICRLHRRTAGSARSAIGGARSDARPVNDHNAEPSWFAKLLTSVCWVGLTHGLPPSSQRRGTQIRDRSRNVPAPHTAGEQI